MITAKSCGSDERSEHVPAQFRVHNPHRDSSEKEEIDKDGTKIRSQNHPNWHSRIGAGLFAGRDARPEGKRVERSRRTTSQRHHRDPDLPEAQTLAPERSSPPARIFVKSVVSKVSTGGPPPRIITRMNSSRTRKTPARKPRPPSAQSAGKNDLGEYPRTLRAQRGRGLLLRSRDTSSNARIVHSAAHGILKKTCAIITADKLKLRAFGRQHRPGRSGSDGRNAKRKRKERANRASFPRKEHRKQMPAIREISRSVPPESR